LSVDSGSVVAPQEGVPAITKYELTLLAQGRHVELLACRLFASSDRNDIVTQVMESMADSDSSLSAQLKRLTPQEVSKFLECLEQILKLSANRNEQPKSVNDLLGKDLYHRLLTQKEGEANFAAYQLFDTLREVPPNINVAIQLLSSPRRAEMLKAYQGLTGSEFKTDLEKFGAFSAGPNLLVRNILLALSEGKEVLARQQQLQFLLGLEGGECNIFALTEFLQALPQQERSGAVTAAYAYAAKKIGTDPAQGRDALAQIVKDNSSEGNDWSEAVLALLDADSSAAIPQIAAKIDRKAYNQERLPSLLDLIRQIEDNPNLRGEELLLILTGWNLDQGFFEELTAAYKNGGGDLPKLLSERLDSPQQIEMLNLLVGGRRNEAVARRMESLVKSDEKRRLDYVRAYLGQLSPQDASAVSGFLTSPEEFHGTLKKIGLTEASKRLTTYSAGHAPELMAYNLYDRLQVEPPDYKALMYLLHDLDPVTLQALRGAYKKLFGSELVDAFCGAPDEKAVVLALLNNQLNIARKLMVRQALGLAGGRADITALNQVLRACTPSERQALLNDAITFVESQMTQKDKEDFEAFRHAEAKRKLASSGSSQAQTQLTSFNRSEFGIQHTGSTAFPTQMLQQQVPEQFIELFKNQVSPLEWAVRRGARDADYAAACLNLFHQNINEEALQEFEEVTDQADMIYQSVAASLGATEFSGEACLAALFLTGAGPEAYSLVNRRFESGGIDVWGELKNRGVDPQALNLLREGNRLDFLQNRIQSLANSTDSKGARSILKLYLASCTPDELARLEKLMGKDQVHTLLRQLGERAGGSEQSGRDLSDWFQALCENNRPVQDAIALAEQLEVSVKAAEQRGENLILLLRNFGEDRLVQALAQFEARNGMSFQDYCAQEVKGVPRLAACERELVFALLGGERVQVATAQALHALGLSEGSSAQNLPQNHMTELNEALLMLSPEEQKELRAEILRRAQAKLEDEASALALLLRSKVGGKADFEHADRMLELVLHGPKRREQIASYVAAREHFMERRSSFLKAASSEDKVATSFKDVGYANWRAIQSGIKGQEQNRDANLQELRSMRLRKSSYAFFPGYLIYDAYNPNGQFWRIVTRQGRAHADEARAEDKRVQQLELHKEKLKKAWQDAEKNDRAAFAKEQEALAAVWKGDVTGFKQAVAGADECFQQALDIAASEEASAYPNDSEMREAYSVALRHWGDSVRYADYIEKGLSYTRNTVAFTGGFLIVSGAVVGTGGAATPFVAGLLTTGALLPGIGVEALVDSYGVNQLSAVDSLKKAGRNTFDAGLWAWSGGSIGGVFGATRAASRTFSTQTGRAGVGSMLTDASGCSSSRTVVNYAGQVGSGGLRAGAPRTLIVEEMVGLHNGGEAVTKTVFPYLSRRKAINYLTKEAVDCGSELVLKNRWTSLLFNRPLQMTMQAPVGPNGMSINYGIRAVYQGASNFWMWKPVLESSVAQVFNHQFKPSEEKPKSQDNEKAVTSPSDAQPFALTKKDHKPQVASLEKASDIKEKRVSSQSDAKPSALAKENEQSHVASLEKASDIEEKRASSQSDAQPSALAKKNQQSHIASLEKASDVEDKRASNQSDAQPSALAKEDQQSHVASLEKASDVLGDRALSQSDAQPSALAKESQQSYVASLEKALDIGDDRASNQNDAQPSALAKEDQQSHVVSLEKALDIGDDRASNQSDAQPSALTKEDQQSHVASLEKAS
ncbi:MAG: hypothetical protein GX589_05935, partial [Deltaproteobacteria bacterium]|nr:hypothetical protein [Deltaproteobacteria bacterium]